MKPAENNDQMINNPNVELCVFNFSFVCYQERVKKLFSKRKKKKNYRFFSE